MAPLESRSSQPFFDSSAIDGPFDIYECGTLAGTRVVPDPPPLPGTSYGKQRASRKAKETRCVHVPEEVQDCWNRLFLEGYQADVRVSTGDGSQILSHSCILVSTVFMILFL